MRKKDLRKKEDSWISGLSNWVEWCCHLHRGKSEAQGQECSFGHKMSRRYLSVNVNEAFGFTDLQEFRGRERAEFIHLEVFRHREDTQSPRTM